jgi:uroporphyrinogen decarboxylase
MHMTPRERLIRSLTFKPIDKIPFQPGWPRESTQKRWRAEGLPEGAYYLQTAADILGIALEPGAVWLPLDAKMRPQFEEEVREHVNGHYIVRDWMGAIVEIDDSFDVTYLRTAKDFVTRRWIKCPVETREEWADMRKRYDAEDPDRLAGMEKAAEEARAEGRPAYLSINGPFWQLREWLGFEGLCIAMTDDPAWVDEMTDFWMGYMDRLLERVCAVIAPDHVMINEDMAYKAHSMISPEMTRRWVLPSYTRWMKRLYAAGTSIFDVDSDGYIGTLLPLWIEAGVNCNSPVEVAAHNDIVWFSDTYGTAMSYRGGIDKRAMAAGGAALRAEMRRIAPVAERGGFIPGCDHGIPPDISWANFLDYAKQLAFITGWL